ncbi:MAG: hypothetical protein ACTSUE_09180 [Promethearchaeota archaeon]
MIVMNIESFWFEIDEFEAAWEEIEDYSSRDANLTNEKAYIMLENRNSDSFLAEMGIDGWYDFPRLVISLVEAGKWGLIVNDEPGRIVTPEELKMVVKDFFEGKIKL